MSVARSVARSIARSIASSPIRGGGGGPALITGLPYPGEELTSTRSGQWRINGLVVVGETGTTFTIPVDADPGDVVSQGGASIIVLDPADAMFYPLADAMFTVSGDLIFA